MITDTLSEVTVSDYADSRWMPPSPHREAILEALRRGRAHIEERGHNLAPLFVYEDGGAMELQLMRLVDGRLLAVAEAQLPDTSTRHVDVCGTVDELKRIWEQEPARADEHPEELLALLDHALAMLRRMEQRLGTYRDFACAVTERADEMIRLERPDHAPVPGLADELRARINAGAADVTQHLPEMFAAAEGIRKIAGDSEQVLYRYRDLAIEVGRLYEQIRGARAWQTRPEDAAPDPAKGG